MRAVGRTDAETSSSAANAETASTEVEAVSSSVRPKGLEPLTFCFGVIARIYAAIMASRVDAEYRELCASESAR